MTRKWLIVRRLQEVRKGMTSSVTVHDLIYNILIFKWLETFCAFFP